MSLLGPGWEKYLDPKVYANNQANSQFNPVLKGLDLQHSRASLIRSQSGANIRSAMQPALDAYKTQAATNAGTSANAGAGIAAMAQQLAQGLGTSGNNAGLSNTAGNYGGLVAAQGATQARSDAQGLTSAQSKVAQMQANRQSELTNKMMDIDKAMLDAKRAKADTYTKAFTEGMGLKQQMIGSALANRGSMINQDVLQAMAPEQLKGSQLANKQAAQNLVWQNIQGQQGVEMNAMQMKSLKQQLSAAGANTTSFFANTPDQKAQSLQGLMGQYIDPSSGGWRSGFNAEAVVNSMYRQMKQLYPGTAKKNSGKMRAAINDWVKSYNGVSNSSNYDPTTGQVADPGIGGSYSTATPTDAGSSGSSDYPSIWNKVP
jgi:hypothetical protein